MSVVRSIDVRCDGCHRLYDNPEPTAAAVRRSAQEDGWKQRGANDYCPECTPPPPTKRAARVNRDEGDCFRAAWTTAETLAADPALSECTIRIVHGLPVGTGDANRGRRFWHAWVEVSDPHGLVRFIDRSNGRDVDAPQGLLYNIGKLDDDVVWRYSLDDARRELLRTQQWGPWVAGWAAMEQAD